eukprot:TRINITY_DN4518_c0_g1_i1.p1 TRINITY_DN4518_c0_g1~~TRINITY_DN4518_c0_g1_i1.p1  ORF type:complete len:511 (-),score=104.96 TRINITY_DN4518_c0_g1_i1:31-1563(-)
MDKEDIKVLKKLVISLSQEKHEEIPLDDSSDKDDVSYWKDRADQLEGELKHVKKDCIRVINSIVQKYKGNFTLSLGNSSDQDSSPGPALSSSLEKKKRLTRRNTLSDATGALKETLASINIARRSMVTEADFTIVGSSYQNPYFDSFVHVTNKTRRLSNIDQRVDLPDIISGPCDGLYIENGEWEPEHYKLNLIPDVYSKGFSLSEHINYIIQGGEKKQETFIVSIITRPEDGGYRGLETRKEGIREFIIETTDPRPSYQKILENHYVGMTVTKIGDPFAVSDIVEIEVAHRQKPKNLRIGVIYVKEGQADPQEMFSNETSGELEKFLHHINVDADELENCTDYELVKTSWKFLSIAWHVAPYQGPEEHRRLIGNDSAIILFLEEGIDSFDPSKIDSIGVVPQIFFVVQPYEDGYRAGFFSRKSIRPFYPVVPQNYIFSSKDIFPFIITKMFNGYLMTTKYCPPMNRLFTTPRKEAIESIAEKYLESSSTKKSFKRKKQAKKRASSMIRN